MRVAEALEAIRQGAQALTFEYWDYSKKPSDQLLCTVEEARELADALRDNTTVTSLSFSNCCNGRECIDVLADMLRTNSTVRIVDFSRNFMEDGGTVAVAEMLRANTTLKSVDVSGHINNRGVNAMGEMLKVNATLTNLTMLYCDIQNSSLMALVEGLRTNRTLLSLKVTVRADPHDQSGVVALCDYLATNTTLKRLVFAADFRQQACVEALAKALRANATLEMLSTFAREIRHVAELIAALRVNKGLRVLRITRSKIGDAGVLLLADALPHLALVELDIRWCKNTVEGANALGEALKAGARLRLLRMDDRIESDKLSEGFESSWWLVQCDHSAAQPFVAKQSSTRKSSAYGEDVADVAEVSTDRTQLVPQGNRRGHRQAVVGNERGTKRVAGS
jgi:Ran GTPase-activating protein (RanGAP) involved in mRNA processing and transport